MVVFSNSSLCAVGEMTSHAPISGTFPHFAARWVDPAFGFAVSFTANFRSYVSTGKLIIFNGNRLVG